MLEPWLSANRLEQLKERKAVARATETPRSVLSGEQEPVAAAPSKRWDRAAYNAYMRENMKKRRAKK